MTVKNLECLEAMRKLKAGSVDLIVTDPPYEIRDMSPYFSEMLRLLAPEGSLYCFGDRKRVAESWYSQLQAPNKDLLIWYYRNSPKPKGRWRLACQLIIYAYREGACFNEDCVRIEYSPGAKKLDGRVRPSLGRLNQKSTTYNTAKGALPRNVIEVAALTGHRARERLGHRDQKPEELIEKLILASSNAGDLVLDPFSGTGTTCAVALRLGRKALGFEINAEWAKESNARCKSARSAGRYKR